MKPMPDELQVILCDSEPEIVRAWKRAFAGHDEVEVRLGDLTEVEADAYVSPANSFGWMDGGIDLALRARFMAGDIEGTVQSAIAKRGGRLPVGEALVVETQDDEVPYLIVAPTMETPSNVGTTSNAYKAMVALLRAVTRFNEQNEDAIGTIAICGLCTGVGGMEPHVAAMQMHSAYVHWLDER